MNYYLYSITNSIDNTKYIGITNDIKKRFREHTLNSSNRYLCSAIRLYGVNNFIFNIECIGSREYISDLEISTIAYYRRNKQLLYNISNGGLIGNGCPGEEHWNHSITEETVLHIRNMYASNLITQRNLALEFDIGYKAISKIVRGERWKEVGGPITTEKQQISKVANRRKLTDTQVVELRNQAKEEYLATNKIDIPDIANLIGVTRGNLRQLLLGTIYANLSGPLLRKDYYRDFGRG